MSDPFRPANYLRERKHWKDDEVVFDLRGLSHEKREGVLLQWAMSRDLHAEVVRVGHNTTNFAATHELSYDPVSALFSGHRMASFETLAAMLKIIGDRAPTYAQIQERLAKVTEITKAYEAAATAGRSFSWPTPQSKGAKSSGGAMRFSMAGDDEPSEPTGPGRDPGVLPIHPDASLAEALLLRSLLTDPRVLAHLGSRRGAEAGRLSFEFDTFIAEDLRTSLVDGFVAGRLLGGRLVLSADWHSEVYERCGGVIDGVFVVRAVEYRRDGSIQEFLGARVMFDPADAEPGGADISIVETGAYLDVDGSVRWR